MDTNSSRSYRGNFGGFYETSWQSPDSRKKTASSRPAFEARQDLPFGRRKNKRVVKLGGTLAAKLSKERTLRLEGSAQYGATSALVGEATKKSGEYFGERPFQGGLLDGSLESDGLLGLELPEAAEASPGAARTSHSLLETARLASYKKRPLGLEPTWSSWMRADSLSFPISEEPGLLKEKLRDSLSPGVGQKSRRSLRSPSRPKENVLDSTHASTPTKTFEPNKSGHYCPIKNGADFVSADISL